MNTSQTCHSIIEGHVHHIISSGNCGTKEGGNKKRSRPWDKCNGIGKGSIDGEYFDSSRSIHKGFIFVPKEQQGIFNDPSDEICNGNGQSEKKFEHTKGNAFPLVIPYQCLKVACNAAATKKLTRISHYSMIHYCDSWGELMYSSRDNGNNKNKHATDCTNPGWNAFSDNNFVVIEVHHDGLSLVSPENKEYFDNQPKEKDEVPSMTLNTLAQKEAQNQQAKGAPNKKKKSKAFGKDPMNVSGVVDAISPILVNDAQENPFAIIELYQPPTDEADTNVKSAVAVIRGELALCMHPAIHPGQSISLIGVVSRKWQVPSEFQRRLSDVKEEGDGRGLYQRLHQRVPDRVISITDASAICWNEKPARSLDMPLPSTVESLTSIRGVIQSVHYHFDQVKGSRESEYVVHFVTLKLIAPTNETIPIAKESSGAGSGALEKQKLARVYLLKYATPPNLALGMQPGAILRAVNIHFISDANDISKCQFSEQVNAHNLSYVACLRSTLAIERCAGESNHHDRSAHPWFVARGKPFTLVPEHRITDICSDPLNTKSSCQYFAEERLRRELESKLSDVSSQFTESPDLEHAQLPIYGTNCHDFKSSDENNVHSIDSRVNALLAHHHRQASIGKLNLENGQSIGCSCTKRKSNHVNGGKNGRLTIRDPYAEFFDHAHNGTFNNATECGSSCNDFASYNHHYHFTSINMPIVAGLGDLRNACAQNFINRVTVSIQSMLQLSEYRTNDGENSKERSRVASGWSSSHHFQGLNLCQVLNDYTRLKVSKDETQNEKSKAWHDVPLESINIYTWGKLETCTTGPNHENATSHINDGSYAIPVCEIWNGVLGNNRTPAFQLESNGSPTWMQIDSVNASCLCLGPSRKESAHRSSNSNQEAEREESYSAEASLDLSPHAFLPSMLVGSRKEGTDGHGFAFRVGSLVFIASVHITARSMVLMDRFNSLRANMKAFRKLHSPQKQAKGEKLDFEMKASCSSICPITKPSAVLSIQECLEQSLEQPASDKLLENSVSIVGRFVRKRFKFRKVRLVQMASGKNETNIQHERCYEGFTIILSHIYPSANDVLDNASAMQNIEVKISVPFGNSTKAKSDALNLALLKLFNSEPNSNTENGTSYKIITPDQATMGLAWWAASEDNQVLPLLSRGWDEGSGQFVREKKTTPPSVHVEIPLTSRTSSNLGYQRFRCNLHEIKSFYVFQPSTSTQVQFCASASRSASSSTRASPYSQQDSEFQGTVKVLPGMLNRRLRRVQPLISNIYQGCRKRKPVYHLRNRHSLLTWLECQGGVPSATLAELHWDICVALKGGNHALLKPSLLRRIHNVKLLGISFCRARVECTQCFKVLTSGLSFNTTSRSANHQFPSSPLNTSPNGVGKKLEKSILFCPSGCTLSHAAVKWECSVIIDDGTGQAKVYAEREAALLLLGGSLDVATIENGAWEIEGGVFFQPALPASSHLMQSITHASIKVKKYISKSRLNKKEKSHEEDVPSTFSLLSADAKAEYLLHQHCRQWYQHHHHRKLDLFCRCKPLSEHVTSVNQTEIQVAKAWVAKMGLDFGTAPTATLPPLKLTLEDACVASEESYEDNTAGWNALSSYKNI